jgi:ribosomal protein S1
VDQLKLGQELEGVVVRTTPEMTLIDLGFKSRGLLPPAKMMAKSEVPQLQTAP